MISQVSGYRADIAGPIEELCCSRNITPGCVARRCRRKRAARRIQQHKKKKKKKGRMKRKRRRWKRKTEKDEYPRRLDQASMTVQLCVGMDESILEGPKKWRPKRQLHPPPPLSLFLSSSLSGQIR